MKIEAFSEGKNLDAPEASEDQFLVLPGSGYAVIDGATDISGRLYDGRSAGWLASQIAMQAIFLRKLCHVTLALVGNRRETD